MWCGIGAAGTQNQANYVPQKTYSLWSKLSGWTQNVAQGASGASSSELHDSASIPAA